MSNILVTGGAGFIGSHLVDRLIENSHNVVVLDNLSSGTNQNDKSKLYVVDLAKESANSLSKIISDHKIEYVYHLAAQINLRQSFITPAQDAQTNIMGTLNLAQAAKENDVKKFIFASTGGAMYSEYDPMPWTELSPSCPQSPYALSKLCAEKYLQLLWPHNSVVLRFANVYGPRQSPHGEAGVISIFLNNMLREVPCKIFGDGRQIRDYIFVSDVVDACVAAIDLSGVFNVSTGVGTDLNTLTLMLLSQSGLKCAIHYEQERPGEMKKSVLVSGKLMQIGNWKPKMSLVDGLQRTIEWFEINNEN